MSLSLGTLHSILGSGHPKCGILGWYTVQYALKIHFHVAKASAIPPFNMGFCQYLPISFFFLKGISNGSRKRVGDDGKLFDNSSCGFIVSNTSINELQA